MLPVCIGSGIVCVIAIAEFDGFLQHPGFVHEESEGHFESLRGWWSQLRIILCGWKKPNELGVQGLVMHVKLTRWGAGIYAIAKRALFYTSKQDGIRVRRPRAWIPCIHSMVAHKALKSHLDLVV